MPPTLHLSKYAPPLTQVQIAELNQLSQLRFEKFNETDVREEFLVPLIRLLGYQRDSDYTVLRKDYHKLNPLFVAVGHKHIELDYKFNVYKAGFWLLEAKKGRCPDPANPPSISDKMIGQAHFYAHHHKIDCPLFGVSNGWWTNIYDRDAEDPLTPLLSIGHSQIPTKFADLNSLIGASQVTFRMKQRLLVRIEQVLSADVDLNRTEEFVREVRQAATRVYPTVLGNFRRATDVMQEASNRQLRDYLERSQPYEVIDNLLLWPLSGPSVEAAAEVLSRKVGAVPGSNHLLFFNQLTVADPRPVTTAYYANALMLLAKLCDSPGLAKVDLNGRGARDTPIETIYVDFAKLLLFHLKSRPDLQVVWAMEGLLCRIIKRVLLSNKTARRDIVAGVELQRYLKAEEELAFIPPSPARTIVETVEARVLAELNLFFHRHATTKRIRHEFDVPGAVAEFHEIRQQLEALERATDTQYHQLQQQLGDDWHEMTAALDRVNRNWDRLGQWVCSVLLANPKLLQQLPQDCRDQLVELARLGNELAKQCAEALGITVPERYPDIGARLRAIFTLSVPPSAPAASAPSE